MLFQSVKTVSRKDGWQWLRNPNDDACSKQFDWQRHESDVGNARLDYEYLIQVNQAEVAEQVGMNRHNVNRSIKKLLELGVVLEGVKIGVSRSYRLNLTSVGKVQLRDIERPCTSI